MRKVLALILAVLIILTFISGCANDSEPDDAESSSTPETSESSSPDPSSESSEQGEDEKSGVITVEGSTALQPLITMAIGKFTEDNEFKGTVTINGSNSKEGLERTVDGKASVGMSDLSPEQAGIDGTELVDHQVAIIAIGVAASKDVAANLKNISSTDLKGIYSGTIKDWQQVEGWKGGSVPISVICGSSGSGARYLFDTYGSNVVLTDEQIGALDNFVVMESANEVYTAVESGQGTIGYLGLPYCEKLELLKIDGVEAKYEQVYTGEYKLWGVEHLYTKGEPKGPVKTFVEFMTSSDFEESITKNGYGLISEMKVSR